MKCRLFALVALLFLVSILGVSAVGTRLNVTMKEVVYNNVTFAENFYETEANPYCRIDGTLNITNPENDTISDIYLVFYNINRMTTDFIRSAGRPGMMYSGGIGTTYEYGEVGNNSNNLTLSQDLDGDNTTDTFWTNGTGVYFSLSTDGLIYIALSNGTSDVSIVNAGTTEVFVNMTGTAISKNSKTYGNLTIIGNATQDNVLNSSMQLTVNEYYTTPIILHIPQLRPQNYTTFIYNVTCLNTDPPVNIETDYTNERHTTIDRKVLAGFNWTINQTAINGFYLDMNITNINITMTAQSVSWNNTVSNFSLEYLYPYGDWSNVSGNGTSNSSWSWAPNGGTLANGTNTSIRFRMTAPDSVPFTATYMALLEEITYDANFLMSNLSLVQINGSAKINTSFEKRISQPADNALSHNVTWEIRPHIDTSLNITFHLNRVTLWVSRNININNYSYDRLRNKFIKVDVGSSTNNYTFTDLDIDEDSSTDYVYVNSTHVLFNISGLSGIQAVSLGTNISGAPGVAVDIRDQEIPSTDCLVTINGTTTAVDEIDSAMNFNVWCRLKYVYGGSPALPQKINISTGWDGSFWYFNYTDGANSSYPPPIVWMKPEWLISHELGQIVNYTKTINGLDVYMKYIYVIHGYWLEVQKNISNIGEDQYRIYTYVENIGNGWTPQYEKVTVYDFVPNNFAPYSWSITPPSNVSVGTLGSEFYGTSYVWDIPWKDGMNSSLGPKYGPLATTWRNYSWNVSYIVNGTGAYKVTELYIVGLDPLKVDGAFASPLIAVITGFQSHSKEVIYVGIVMFLVIVNLANLIITQKINKKLDIEGNSQEQQKTGDIQENIK